MDLSFVIQQRLKELGIEQRDLAAAAQVTESYISQLLSRKKAPPAVDRTGLYDKMNSFLKFPPGHLSSLVLAQYREELKKKLADPPEPLFKELRELILRKCQAERRSQVREIFEKQAFGELERLVSQTLLDVTNGIAREELKNEDWLRGMARLGHKTFEEVRAASFEFLETDVFNVSIEHCATFLDPMIDSWDIELKTFAVEVLLNKRLAFTRRMQFRFVQAEDALSPEEEPGFQEFLRNLAMSGDATAEELDFLKGLRFKQRSPSPLYYYRELQSLRDPLHFPESSGHKAPERGGADGGGRPTNREFRKKPARRRSGAARNSWKADGSKTL